MARPIPLTVELLEDRRTPAAFGTPWIDPLHLTLSFAPDGTDIAGHGSTLFQTLDAQEPTAAWQRAILRAVQTWTVNANLSVGVVPDGGQPFGTPGPQQGDPRFGDIRIGAQPMAPSVLAVSVPLDPYLGGTWSGDILLNSTYDFTRPESDLYGVMLHEFGHALGLAENGDPTSVLSRTTTAPQRQLSPADIAAVQALYGPHTGAHHEDDGASHGTSTFATATPLSYSTRYDGTTPLAAFGDVTTAGDAHVYSLTSLPAYAGPVTFMVQTAGLSLFQPRLTVFDAQGNVLGTAQSSNDAGDVLVVSLAQTTPGALYYARIDGAGQDVFGIGRYALAVTFDTKLTVPASVINRVLRGPYNSLESGDLAEVFHSANAGLVLAGDGDNHSFLSARALRTTRGFLANEYYNVLTGLGEGSAYYAVQAPQGTGPVVLTATVDAEGSRGVVPALAVYDANQNPVPFTVLLASGFSYTIQAVNLQPGQSYYVVASLPYTGGEHDGEHGGPHGGNFTLVVDFRQPAQLLQTFASGTLTGSAAAQTFQLYVALPQLFGLTLSTAGSAPAGTTVQMTIVDANGVVVDQLTAAAAGPTAAPGSALLGPGPYTVQFTLVSPAGTLAGPVPFVLLGDSLSDPIGPVVGDPTQTPLYQLPNDPLHFLYPDGQVVATPFLWVALVL
jgi:hypothetical protein